MLMISTIVNYRRCPPSALPGQSRAARVREIRAERRDAGLCMQCGGACPCAKHAAATKRWREAQKEI